MENQSASQDHRSSLSRDGMDRLSRLSRIFLDPDLRATEQEAELRRSFLFWSDVLERAKVPSARNALVSEVAYALVIYLGPLGHARRIISGIDNYLPCREISLARDLEHLQLVLKCLVRTYSAALTELRFSDIDVRHLEQLLGELTAALPADLVVPQDKLDHRGYFEAILRNAALTILRDRRARGRYVDDDTVLETLPSSSPSPALQHDLYRTLARIERIREESSSVMREAIAHNAAELTTEEAARASELPPCSAVASRRRRTDARKYLRARYPELAATARELADDLATHAPDYGGTIDPPRNPRDTTATTVVEIGDGGEPE